MSDQAIRVEGLGKRYQLGGASPPYATIREQIGRWVARRAPIEGRRAGPAPAPFWALRDVSFEVARGEAIGIIGRNGAGKSTLLKLLSRITEPTTGWAEIRGRVGSLLEVGTGFHPELTGRENVFLNGAILGMRRSEIAAKFDEIVAFAEVERFVETPVKHYSSGMYTRLAFAVAAHLEPEILVVDEVLAVGDVDFRRKCLGKMNDVARGGRTILFVSHDMGAIQALCDRAILLERGGVRCSGPVDRVVAEYLATGAVDNTFVRPDGGSIPIRIESVEVAVRRGRLGPELEVATCIRADRAEAVSLDILVQDELGATIGFAPVGSFDPEQEVFLEAGVNRILSRHSLRDVANGSYLLSIGVADTMVCYHDRVEQCVKFEVQEAPAPGRFRRLDAALGYGHFELPYLHHERSGAVVDPEAALDRSPGPTGRTTRELTP